MANAPLSGRDGKSYSLIIVSEKQKYFFKRGWTRQANQVSAAQRIGVFTALPLHSLDKLSLQSGYAISSARRSC
jgi:hypothetical protein